MPEEVRRDLHFVWVDTMDQVLEHALAHPPGAGAGTGGHDDAAAAPPASLPH